ELRLTQGTLDCRAGGLAEAADRCIAHDLSELAEERELVVSPAVGGGRARREAGQELFLADGPDPAGHALATRFVAEEAGDPGQRADHVGGLVEDEHDARAKGRPDRS